MLSPPAPLFAWTAFFAIAIVAAIMAVLLLLALVHWLLPPGKLRTAVELLLALLGLGVTLLLTWS